MLVYFLIDFHKSLNKEIIYILNKVHPNIAVHTHTNTYPLNKMMLNSLNKTHIDEYREKYKNYLQGFDGFIVCYPNILLMLYEPFNKPVIMLNTNRYDMPLCLQGQVGIDNLMEYHAAIRRLDHSNHLIIISNNQADMEYLHMGMQYRPRQHYFIPTLGAYTQLQYNTPPNTMETSFLICSGSQILYPYLTGRLPKNVNITCKELLGPNDMYDLTKYNAIVHLPNEISSFSMAEQYYVGIQLILPTKRLLKEACSNYMRPLKSRYWHNNDTGHDFICPTNLYLALINDDWWINKAIYYSSSMDTIIYYDTFDELIELLTNWNNTLHMHKSIHKYKYEYENTILKKWDKCLKLFYDLIRQ